MVKFSSISEAKISRAIVKEFNEFLSNYIESDVIIVGGGPSGLMAGKRLAENGFKTLLIEANNYLGGGFWMGGFFMNTVTFRDPSQRILKEIGVPYKEAEAGLFTVDGPHVCSRLIASACDAGLKILNLVRFDDLVLKKNNKVGGVVINWAAVESLPKQVRCIDPIAIESRLVIDSTGHDACVANQLAKLGLLEMKGEKSMWVEKSEDLIVEQTGEVHPGLIVTGMAVASVYGVPRMGPTFGAMLYSGIKGADEAKRILSSSSPNISDREEILS
ncbi:MAG: sulfide-dependent adenosine diphosphate thiazole synthase [Candidatus Kaelpia imicola]|nr:sulfide-dependent adenosine diphosphate thiazole synthase [Candidatus Kaelpia imicola]